MRNRKWEARREQEAGGGEERDEVLFGQDAEAAESFRLFGQGLWLSATGPGGFGRPYLRALDQSSSPLVSPLRTPDFLGLPPALVRTAEFDILADQGRSYGECLREAGVSAARAHSSSMLHDVVTLPGLFSPAWDGMGEITAALREVFDHGRSWRWRRREAMVDCQSNVI